MPRYEEIINGLKPTGRTDPFKHKNDDDSFGEFLSGGLASGTGAFLSTLGNLIESGNRPDGYGVDEWRAINKNLQINPNAQWLQETGTKLQADNIKDYTPGSAKYYGNLLLNSVPEMAVDMGVSAMVGAGAGAAAGPEGMALGALVNSAAKGGKWARRALNAFQGHDKLAKAVTFLDPAAGTLAGGLTARGLESVMEGQRAADEYIAEAKRNGTYITGQTEQEAENLKNGVIKWNTALVGNDMAQYATTFGGKGKGFLRGLGRFALNSGLEGAEEGVQYIIPNELQNKPWSTSDREFRDSVIVGALMGGAMHGAGSAVNSAVEALNNRQRVDSSGQDILQAADAIQQQRQQNNNAPQGLSAPQTMQPTAGAQGERQQVQSVSLEGAGSGEGTVWKRQTDGVSYEGARPETMKALDLLGQWFYNKTGKPLVVTAVTNGTHADGEHSHGAGWKADVNDWGSGAEGTLLGQGDGEKGSLTDEFIAYGQSLGLGMNWEGDHIDVSASGEQWEGEHAGRNFGGLNLSGAAQNQEQTQEQNTLSGGTNEEKIWSWLKAEGFTDEGAAGVMGNLRQEAGADFAPNAVENGGSGFKIDGQTGYGIAQWTDAGRQRGLQQMAEAMGKDVSDLDVQLAYLKKEMQDYGIWDKVRNADNVQAATQVFHDEYEKSNDYNAFGNINHRHDFANEYITKHGGKTYSGARAAQAAPNSQGQNTNAPQVELPQESEDEFTRRYNEAMALLQNGQISREQRDALFTVARETQQGDMPEGLSAEQEAEYWNEIEDALTRQDTVQLARLLERQKVADAIKPRRPQGGKGESAQANIQTPTPNLDRANRQQQTLTAENVPNVRQNVMPTPQQTQPQGQNQKPSSEEVNQSLQNAFNALQQAAARTGQQARQTQQASNMLDAATQNLLAQNQMAVGQQPTQPSQANAPQTQIQPQTAPQNTPQQVQSPQVNNELDEVTRNLLTQNQAALGQTTPGSIDAAANVVSDRILGQAAPQNSQVQNTAQSAQPPMTQGKSIQGKETKILTDQAREVPARYRVMEAGDIVSSHNADFSTNAKYPAELQPRDRGKRQALMQQITSMSQNLRPEDLMDSRNLNQGAPVVRGDGVVLNGNGRVMAISRAYGQGKANAYKATLKAKAQELGLNPADIDKMKNPVLVREVSGNLSEDEMRDVTTSTTGGARLGASEQARADAEKLTEQTLNLYVPNEYGDLTTAANRDFVAAALRQITTSSELNAYTDAKGNTNADGIARVKRAVFALAYGDEQIIGKMTESTNDAVKNIINGLSAAAPIVAKTELAMRQGEIRQYPFAQTVADTVKQLDAIREQKKSVSKYLREQGMFAEHEYSAESKEILTFFDAHRRSAKAIGEYLTKAANIIASQGNVNQTSLIATEPLSLMDVLRAAKNAVENRGGQNLFAETPMQEQAQAQGQEQTQEQNTGENKNVASQATNASQAQAEPAPTKKAADGDKQESAGSVANSDSNENANESGVVVVMGDEFGDYKDIKELRTKAIDYYRKNLQGTSVENKELGRIDIDENGLVEFTTEGRQKVKANSANEETLLLIKYLPQLIKNAKSIEHKDAVSEKHRKLGDSFYYLQTSYVRNGETVPLEITLKKLHTGDIHYYNHTVNPKQHNFGVPVSPRTESSNEANVSKADSTPIISDSNIAQESEKGNSENSQKGKTAAETEVEKQKRIDEEWGTQEERENALLEALGIPRANTPKAKSEPKTENEPDKKATPKKVKASEKSNKSKTFHVIDDSDEALEAAWAEIDAIMKRMHSGVPVDVLAPLLKVGLIYVQRGANNFTQFAKSMLERGGEDARGLIRPAWKMVQAYPENRSFNETQVIPALNYIGGEMAKVDGKATFEEVSSKFASLVGEEKAAQYNDLLNVAYKGAYSIFNDKEVTDNELYDDATDMATRDGEENNQNAVGQSVQPRVPVNDGGRSVQTPDETDKSQDSGGVHGRSTTTSRTVGNSRVQAGESADRGNSPGSTELSGSIRDSLDGTSGLDDGRTAKDIESAKDRPVNATAKAVNKKVPYKVGSLESIQADLPFLLPEQAQDVVKAEKRLLTENKTGMMFTNGTGTGKTFTGLGVVKRFANQGKKNIVIVAPTDKIMNDWIHAAKGFFGLNIHKLGNTKFAGKNGDIIITTYANFGQNETLVKRDWDLVISDESHYLMSGEKGADTNALKTLRKITYHHEGLHLRHQALHAAEYEQLHKLSSIKAEDWTPKEQAKYKELSQKLREDEQTEREQWQEMKPGDKPKVVFLSATPFAYTKAVDYAEGYLFDYSLEDGLSAGYNRFFIEHFGYRIRYGKLTQPDADVNQDLMEIQFNTWLKETGALSGRMLKVDKDYERGFILVDSGIGAKIDAGMEILEEDSRLGDNAKYPLISQVIRDNLKGLKSRYILEAIKAKQVVPLVQEYLKAGKKVVLFHDYKKNEATNPFVFDDEDLSFADPNMTQKARAEYEKFKQDHPELMTLDLGDLKSPIEVIQENFGDKARIFNGGIPKKQREKFVQEFNNDDSGIDLILIQRASGKEGISLHDTTGKHQRVLIDLGLATKPTDIIQTEGRIYRTGVVSNAIIRYLNTGTQFEKSAFASTIAGRASTAENLAMGEGARALKESIVNSFNESLNDEWQRYLPNTETEGTGGKERDARSESTVSEYDKAKTYYFARQKKTSQNKAREGKDYYATPEPIGYKMVEWLGLKAGESVLEPSAGHGAISRWFPADTKNTIIEPSGELSTSARMTLKGGSTSKVVDGLFENFDLHNKADGIAMNPPFGTGGKTAVEHIAKAYNHLKDGGRLVAILPEGASADAHFNKWFYGEDKNGNEVQKPPKGAVLTAQIHLPSVTFNRAGTSVATRIVVIDKQMNQAAAEVAESNAGKELDLRDADSIKELFDELEDVTVPERVDPNTRNQSRATTNETQNAETTDNSNGTTNFETGDFTHTKTGEKIPQAKLKRQVTREYFNKLVTIAKNHGGAYSRFYSQSFLFQKGGEEGRDAFLREAETLLEANGHDAAYSIDSENNAETKELLDSITPVANEELTAQEKLLSDFSQELGVPLMWVDADPALNGRYDHTTGGIQLNRKGAHQINGKRNITHTFWHELLHWLAYNNEDVYAQWIEYMQDHAPFTEEQVAEWKKANNRETLNDGAAVQEMLCDYFTVGHERMKILRDMAKENPSLAKRFVAWIKRVMDRFIEMFHNPKGKLTTAQKDAFIEVFGKTLMQLKDANGRNIFRVAQNGRNISLVDGRALPRVSIAAPQGVGVFSLNSKNGIDNSENLSDNLSKVIKRVKDDMSLAEVRELFLGEENHAVVQAMLFCEKQKKHFGLSNELSSVAANALKEVYEYVCIQRHRFNNPESIDNLARLLQRHNKARKGSYLAENLQEYFNGGGHTVLDELIPGEHRRTSDKVEKLLKEFGLKANTKDPAPETPFKDGILTQFDAQKQNTPIDASTLIQGAFSNGANSVDASTETAPEQSFLERAFNRMTHRAHINGERIITEERQAPTDPNVVQHYLGSPSRIAEKVKMFRPFFRMANKAMNTLTKSRSDFARKLEAAKALVKNPEDKEKLYEVLWTGDKTHKEWTKQELIDEGYGENVAEAYIRIRRLFNKAYRMVNDARRRVRIINKNVTDKQLEALRDNKFVEIKSISNYDIDGKWEVTYKEYANWTKEYNNVTEEELSRFENDDAMQVLEYENNGDGTYKVSVREAVPDLTKRKGYVPHFFHEYFIQVRDADGKAVERYGQGGGVIGSGRTEKEAVERADEWLKNNQLKSGETVYIAPKTFDFNHLGMDETQYAAIMGDKDYDNMVQKIAKANQMTLAEVKKFLADNVSKKNRHRFFGNLMHRKGVEGYEENLDWVLRHYFNSASRYYAMETEFKPQAISLFERWFGDFNKKYTGLAEYVQDYINDINGTPTTIEKKITDMLNRSSLWRKFVVSNFGDRAALQLAGTVTGWTSYLCLGYLNVSSALLNLTQMMNIAAYLGDTKAIPQILHNGFKRKYSLTEQKVLLASNVLNDIGLDSGSGYDINRNQASRFSGKGAAKAALNALGTVSRKGMILFKTTESAMRKGAILTAYKKARAEGKTHGEAIEYAQEINRKSNFDYGVADAPNIFRRGSIISQLALQFKKYGIKELEVMGDMLPYLSKSTNSKQKMMFWGMYFLACGLLGLPALGWLDKLLDERLKDFAQETIMETCNQNAATKAIGQLAMYGLAAPVVGIDLSTRAGLADVIPTRATDLAGPVISKTLNFAGDVFGKGDYASGLRDVSPGLYNQYAAWFDGESTGSRGRVNTYYDDFYSRALKAAGFKSVDERIASDVQRITYNRRGKLTKEKQAAVDAYIANPTTENAMKLKELGVKPKTVEDERERKKADRLGRTRAGMSKTETERNKELLKFAE